LLPQLAHASLESSLVEARCCVVVRVRVDAEGAADRGNQMLLVHLRIALYGLVFDTLGYVAELRDGLVTQLLEGYVVGLECQAFQGTRFVALRITWYRGPHPGPDGPRAADRTPGDRSRWRGSRRGSACSGNAGRWTDAASGARGAPPPSGRATE